MQSDTRAANGRLRSHVSLSSSCKVIRQDEIQPFSLRPCVDVFWKTNARLNGAGLECCVFFPIRLKGPMCKISNGSTGLKWNKNTYVFH